MDGNLPEISYNNSLDQVEAEMQYMEQAKTESYGFFCGGMFIKPIYVPAGSYITSKIHKDESPFFFNVR